MERATNKTKDIAEELRKTLLIIEDNKGIQSISVKIITIMGLLKLTVFQSYNSHLFHIKTLENERK